MIMAMAGFLATGWDHIPQKVRFGVVGIALTAVLVLLGMVLETGVRWVIQSLTTWDAPDLGLLWEGVPRIGFVLGLIAGAVLAGWHICYRLGKTGRNPWGLVSRFRGSTTFERFTRSVREPLSQWSLLKSVLAMLMVAFSLVVLAWWIISMIIETSDSPAPRVEITKIALTIAGGIGASVALVVGYRKQRDSEANRFVERFGAAAAQLGGDDPAVRLAGVYAMAALADDSPKPLWQQQCVDVLCAYLRMPHDADSTNNHQIEQSKSYEDPTDSAVTVTDQFKFRYNDNEVRKTIVRTIVEHLQPDAESPWSDLKLDFSGAEFESADFSLSVVKKSVNFERCKFSGTTYFNGVQFHEGVNFDGSEFLGPVLFCGGLSRVGNIKVKLGEATYFRSVVFHDTAMWTYAEFSGDVTFGGSFSRGRRTEFKSMAVFQDVGFKGIARFKHVKFHDISNFQFVEFSSAALFDRQIDGGPVEFDDSLSFHKVEFHEGVKFDNAIFGSEATFDLCNFHKEASFQDGHFSGPLAFSRPAFSGFGNFQRVTFGGETKFVDPVAWVQVHFDWDSNPALKPSNVYPSNWPPQVVPAP